MQDESVYTPPERIEALQGGILEIESHEKRLDRLYRTVRLALVASYIGIISLATGIQTLITNESHPAWAETAVIIGFGLAVIGTIKAFTTHSEIKKYDNWIGSKD